MQLKECEGSAGVGRMERRKGRREVKDLKFSHSLPTLKFSLFQPTVGSRCDWQDFLALIARYHSGVGLSSVLLLFFKTSNVCHRLPVVVLKSLKTKSIRTIIISL